MLSQLALDFCVLFGLLVALAFGESVFDQFRSQISGPTRTI